MYTNRGHNCQRQECEQEAKKMLKYKDLTTEIQCMGNVKTKVVPVIMEPSQTYS